MCPLLFFWCGSLRYKSKKGTLVELLESSICPILRGTSTHLSFPAQIRLWLEFHELAGHPKPLKTSQQRPRPQIPTEGYLCASVMGKCIFDCILHICKLITAQIHLAQNPLWSVRKITHVSNRYFVASKYVGGLYDLRLWFECKKEAVGLFRAFLLRCHETIEPPRMVIGLLYSQRPLGAEVLFWRRKIFRMKRAATLWWNLSERQNKVDEMVN